MPWSGNVLLAVRLPVRSLHHTAEVGAGFTGPGTLNIPQMLYVNRLVAFLLLLRFPFDSVHDGVQRQSLISTGHTT